MSTDKNHSEQFERYLKGQMSPEEAHAFERKVLDDPFALEALEGFEEQGANTLNDLEHLRSQIRGEQKQTWSWMRIAAVIALLIVGSFTIYYFTGQVEGEQLAMEKEPTKDLIQSGPEPDTIRIDSKRDNQNPEETQKDTFEKDGLKVKDKDEEVVENYLAENEPEITREELNANPDKKLKRLIEATDAEEIGQLEGEKKVIRLDDTNALEEIVVESDDELIVMEEMAIPAQPFNAKKKVAREVDADETITTQSARGRSSGGGEVNNQADVPPKPSVGDTQYKKYLKEELMYPAAAQTNNIEGEVILRLTINNSGAIIDVKIEKSLGYGCDEEAIRLVKEGPAWESAIKNGQAVSDSIEVEIAFKN